MGVPFEQSFSFISRRKIVIPNLIQKTKNPSIYYTIYRKINFPANLQTIKRDD